MKVKDLIEMKTEIDVYDNYTEELGVAYCGTQLTEAGKKKYADVLEFEIESIKDEVVVIAIDNGTDPEAVTEKKLAKAMDMFYGMAGYCSTEKYDKYFID